MHTVASQIIDCFFLFYLENRQKVDMIMIFHNHLDTKQNRYRLDIIDKYFLSGKQKLSVDTQRVVSF